MMHYEAVMDQILMVHQGEGSTRFSETDNELARLGIGAQHHW